MIGIGGSRLGQLDSVLVESTASLALAEELFAVADEVDANPALRRLLTDYTKPEAARRGIAAKLFADKVSAATLAVLVEAVSVRWREIGSLAAALDRQGVRAVWLVATKNDEMDDLETGLFKLSRIIRSHPDLAVVLDDQTTPRADRARLLARLLTGKLSEGGLLLANRALTCRERNVELTLDSYLALAAAQRDRAIVKVTAAQPLTAEQEDRLRSVLSAQLGRKVTLQLTIDPAVLGGLALRVGDDAIEGTVAGRLQQATELIA